MVKATNRFADRRTIHQVRLALPDGRASDTKLMRFAIVGAGAIGAFLGAMLARSGEDVTLIARGPHLRAMQEHGVRIRGEAGEFQVNAKATDDPRSIGEVDVVIITLKAQSLPAMAPNLAPLIGACTSI